MAAHRPAPELITRGWLNTDSDLSLTDFRGKVVMIEAFQMLCPGCVSHGLPQAQKVHQTFSRDDVAVIGLHTVFEHHAAQGSKEALEAFLHEYRVPFPVALDAWDETGKIPLTMRAYQMRGTPTLLLIDRQGNLRKQVFGGVDDLALGAEIMAVLRDKPAPRAQSTAARTQSGCTDEGCAAPNL